MSARKTDGQPGVSRTFDEAYAGLVAQMRTLHLSRIAEMPKIELYLDQLLSLVSMELAFLYDPDERIVTGAMVNNYVKQGLLPAPKRKRYTRRHLAWLLFVCTFKRVLSIAQVAQLRDMCRALDVDVERAYDDLAEILEQALAAQFTEDLNEHARPVEICVSLRDSEGNAVVGELNHLLECAVMLLADKVYLEHLLALEAARVG